MKVPVVDQCCCGCTLRTGTLTIGILWTISTFLGLISYSVLADQISHVTEENVQYLQGIQGMLIFICIITAIECAVSVALVYGTLADKPSLMFPWIAVSAVVAVLNVLSFLVTAIIYFVALQVGSGIGVLLWGFLSLALLVYFIVVVHSYYLTLTSGVSGGGGITTHQYA